MEEHTHFSLTHRASALRHQAEASRTLLNHVIERGQFPKACFDLDRRAPSDEMTRHLFETWCCIEYPGLYTPVWDQEKYRDPTHQAMFKGWLAGYEKGWFDATNIVGGLETAKWLQEGRNGR